MVDRDEVQGEVDAAGDARRRGEPAVGDVEDVGHHLASRGGGGRAFPRLRGAWWRVVRRAACLSERERAGTHAHDAAAAVVVLDEPPEQRRWRGRCGVCGRRRGARDQHDVLGAEVGPVVSTPISTLGGWEPVRVLRHSAAGRPRRCRRRRRTPARDRRGPAGGPRPGPRRRCCARSGQGAMSSAVVTTRAKRPCRAAAVALGRWWCPGSRCRASAGAASWRWRRGRTSPGSPDRPPPGRWFRSIARFGSRARRPP